MPAPRPLQAVLGWGTFSRRWRIVGLVAIPGPDGRRIEPNEWISKELLTQMLLEIHYGWFEELESRIRGHASLRVSTVLRPNYGVSRRMSA